MPSSLFGAGLMVAEYEATVPPLPAGADQDADSAPSVGVRTSEPGGSGNPAQGAMAALSALDTQVFTRARTVGVSAVTGTVTVTPLEAPTARLVAAPSVTS